MKYTAKRNTLKITTTVAAGERLFTRVYPVGDLVIPIRTPMAGGLGQGLGGVGGMAGGAMGGGQFGGGGGGGRMGGGMFNVNEDHADRRLPRSLRRGDL